LRHRCQAFTLFYVEADPAYVVAIIFM
jgi:hypothetical protein